MNKKLEKKFEEEFKDDENVLFAVGVKDNVKAFIDEHLTCKNCGAVHHCSNDQEEVKEHPQGCVCQRCTLKLASQVQDNLFTKEKVLEIIGKKINVVKEWEIWEEKGQDYINGYNQAKAEARERLNK